MDVLYKVGVISQERLKIEVKLLLSANRTDRNMPRRLAQQRMTFSGLNDRFTLSASRAISAAAELFVVIL